MKRETNFAAEVIAICYLTIVLWVTLSAINETVLRSETAKLIVTERGHLTQQLLDATQAQASAPKPESPPAADSTAKERPASPELAPRDPFSVDVLKRQLHVLDTAELALITITLSGGNQRVTASSILEQIATVGLVDANRAVQEDKSASASYIGSIIRFNRSVAYAGYLPSETLLGVLLLGSGVLGSLFAKVRSGDTTRTTRPTDLFSLQPFLMGASAGFMCFLVLRGGRSVFLMDYTAQFQYINPYSASFAALIAGMFTDRAYKILSVAVESVAQKIEAVVKSDTATTAPESTAAQTPAPTKATERPSPEEKEVTLREQATGEDPALTARNAQIEVVR